MFIDGISVNAEKNVTKARPAFYNMRAFNIETSLIAGTENV